MTNREYREKYPIGTKIKYIGWSGNNREAAKDIGRTGTIVGYISSNKPIIFLPKSKNVSMHSTPFTPASWQVAWEHIKVLPQKNQQLEFAFMQTGG